MNTVSSEPLVSVVASNYNYAHYLPEFIESVFAQSHKNLELIIYDDGSTDNSCEVLEDYQQRDARLRMVVGEKNQGVAAGYNCAIAAAQGEYIALNDTDNILLPNKLKNELAALRKGQSTLVASRLTRIAKRASGYYMYPAKSHPEIAAQMFFSCSFPNCFTVSRKLLKQVGVGYSKRSGAICDYDFLFSLMLAGKGEIRYEILPEVGLQYRLHPQQQTKSDGAKQRFMFYQALGDKVLNEILGGVGESLSDDEYTTMRHCLLAANYPQFKATARQVPLHFPKYEEFFQIESLVQRYNQKAQLASEVEFNYFLRKRIVALQGRFAKMQFIKRNAFSPVLYDWAYQVLKSKTKNAYYHIKS